MFRRMIGIVVVAACAAPAVPAQEMLVLADGRRIAVRSMVRRDGRVLFETIRGEHFAVAEKDVASPPLESIPGLGADPAPAPSARRPAPEPDPAPEPIAEPAAEPAPEPEPVPPQRPEPPPLTNEWSGAYPLPPLTPLGYAGESKVPAAGDATDEFIPMPDRWRLGFRRYERYEPSRGMPWVEGSVFDPYNQNVLKSDYPIRGDDLFTNLNLQSVSALNPRRRGADGPQDELFLNQNLVAGLELFKGDTVFRPKDWAVRATAVLNYRRVTVEERNPNSDSKLALEEGFAEARFATYGAQFDFSSLRAGMQNFNSDFRGFVFTDNQLGLRVFGTAGGNRHQFNLVYFDMRERDAATQLHTFGDRQQEVFIGNWFIQDVGPGHTLLLSVHHNRDQGPPRLGRGTPGELEATYLGLHGDGHFGATSVSWAVFQVLGNDGFNQIRNGPVRINAQLAALELSWDADWRRFRTSLLYASGDGDPDDDQGRGFDSIVDNPNFAGGDFSFWSSQATALDDRGLSNTQSLLLNLRNKFAERSNFVNPGLMLGNVGLDFRLSPKLELVTNASYLRMVQPEPLAAVAGQAELAPDIGFDVGLGLTYRPLLNENLKIVLGGAALLPRGGLEQVLGSADPLFTAVGALQLAF